MTKPPDARHRAVAVLERGLTDSGCDIAAGLARELLIRLEAAGLAVHDIPAAIGPTTGFCDFHAAPRPCHGCAADAKAVHDDPTPHDAAERNRT